MNDKKKVAIIVCNLGGPDSLSSVRLFLKNLFSDPAILPVPRPIRWFLARFISLRRAKIARNIYNQIGGKSPILLETKQQSEALEKSLNNQLYKVFIAMRYWHPFTTETMKQILDWNAEKIILLPLYPQFSTTTTGSSITELNRVKSKIGFDIPTTVICCYPDEENFINAHVELIRESIVKLKNKQYKILFSAHGLPESIIKKGDPYESQIKITVDSIVESLNISNNEWTICYQSKVTPVKWLEPKTEDEIIKASKQNLSIIMVPIAFVSEHSETLVELDIEYYELAKTSGIKEYHRVPTLSCRKLYIDSLKNMIMNSLKHNKSSCIISGGKHNCSKKYISCPLNNVGLN
ncbi:ferrochelatase [Alphaproteobacteria bacterium]|nr:ferrochelatase [Alphaproteobacteria bacterium]